MIAAAVLLAAAPAHRAALACGSATFRIDSTDAIGTDPPLAPVHQRLRRVGYPTPLRLDRLGTVTIDGRQVQRGYVLSWACMRARSGMPYVLLGYACAIDPGDPGACPAGKEWFRLLDTRGRAVGADVPTEGLRWTALLRRLGLAGAMARGVPMKDVLG